jgi:Leucine-rich repeat (LRR) protein
MSALLQSAILLTAIAVGLTLGQVCPYRECACGAGVIDCSNRGLTAIPTRLNTGTTFYTLLLNGNQITSINASSLLPTRLDTLDLSDNPISSITPDSLYGISQTLKSIKFRNSNFEWLPQALEILDSLTTLDMENDSMMYSIATIAKLAMKVTSLRLANAGLVYWPTWLRNFLFLRRLYLDGNTMLTSPPAGTFESFSQTLTHLSLSNIGASSFGAISVLSQLQWLDLSRNVITDSVSLSYNLIPLYSTLQYLDLSRNRLISEPRLVDLQVLTEANLSYNNISTVDFGSFSPSIISINLENNNLKSMPKSLGDLPQLQTFNIRSNAIIIIGNNDFPLHTRLSTISLGDNPISYIGEHSFDNFRQTLTYLDLENTQLTRLPVAVSALTSLQTLWMPSNANLMCTCEEKALAPWMTSLPALRVVGQCGGVDIKRFFSLLAAQCP